MKKPYKPFQRLGANPSPTPRLKPRLGGSANPRPPMPPKPKGKPGLGPKRKIV